DGESDQAEGWVGKPSAKVQNPEPGARSPKIRSPSIYIFAGGAKSRQKSPGNVQKILLQKAYRGRGRWPPAFKALTIIPATNRPSSPPRPVGQAAQGLAPLSGPIR